MKNKVNIFWFRRDLRLHDNIGLHHALNSSTPTLLLFIFDSDILESLDKDDARVTLIYNQLGRLNEDLNKYNASIKIALGKPYDAWQNLIEENSIESVYTNGDYEPYSIKRDGAVSQILSQNQIDFNVYKDHIVFHPSEVLKPDGTPYTVYTPYSRRWKSKFHSGLIEECTLNFKNLYQKKHPFPTIEKIGFQKSNIKLLPVNYEWSDYHNVRDIPSLEATSNLSPYLRFGMVSIRDVVRKALSSNEVFLNELIWREFFVQIMYHFPYSMNDNFKKKYDEVKWRNNEQEFEKWCNGQTGYPIVDAGMRQLNETGYMHNRVRMIVASFLCKHLLIDWRWGEAYFASKLLDYEMASNVGNWQWAASTGCDATPYFRIFNPESQQKKFDPKWEYIRKWVEEVDLPTYPQPIVEHKYARERALEAYKIGLNSV